MTLGGYMTYWADSGYKISAPWWDVLLNCTTPCHGLSVMHFIQLCAMFQNPTEWKYIIVIFDEGHNST